MIVVLTGPPGGGKGTQAAFITRDFGLPHVSTGDMLRAQAGAGGDLGGEVAAMMAAGRLVPDQLILRVIEERLRRPDVRDGLVLDGFPRTVAQAQALDTMLGAARRGVDIVISLAVPVEAIVERLLGRAREQARSDDTQAAVRVRMAEYEAKTVPVLEHYRALGATVVAVDGVGSVEQVRERIHAQLVAARDGEPAELTGSPARARRAEEAAPGS